jgi:hypothetical protein
MRNTLKQILILLDYCIAKNIVTCEGNIGYKNIVNLSFLLNHFSGIIILKVPKCEFFDLFF